MFNKIFVSLPQQKKEKQRKGQNRIERASHGYFLIVVD